MQWGLIQLRKEHGLTQKDMATILGISERQYIDKEHGRYDFKLSEMITVHNYFQVTMDEIFLPRDCIKNAIKEG